MKTANLTGPALDWAVAKCEGFTEYDPLTEKMLPPRKEYGWVSLCEYHYSTDWSQGGSIIERERIGIWCSAEPHKGLWCAADYNFTSSSIEEFEQQLLDIDDPIHGPTPLIAAMRCYVASKLGDEVEIPDNIS